MSFKLSVVFVNTVASLSFAADHISDDHYSKEPKPFPLPHDVIGSIVAFCAPFHWNDLFIVSSDFYASRSQATKDLKREWPQFIYSAKLDFAYALQTAIQPGWKGMIANEHDCILVHYSDQSDNTVHTNVPLNGQVKVTGIQNDVSINEYCDRTECSDYFIHRSNIKKHGLVNVRNIHTGQEIRFAGLKGELTMINANKLISYHINRVSEYTLDWNNEDPNVRRVHRKDYVSIPVDYFTQVLNDGSILVYDGESERVGKYHSETDNIHWIAKNKGWFGSDSTPDGTVLLRSSDDDYRTIQTIIESIDGRTRLICIPQETSAFFPSPDSRHVIFRVKQHIVLMNLYSGVISVIGKNCEGCPDYWVSDDIFRSDYDTLRHVNHPRVDWLTLNEDDFKMDELEVGSVLDAKDLLCDFSRIGPNLFYSEYHRKVIQLEWLLTGDNQ